MPRTIIKQPDGNWCVYSSIVEGFIIEDASMEDIIEYYVEKEREERTESMKRLDEKSDEYHEKMYRKAKRNIEQSTLPHNDN